MSDKFWNWVNSWIFFGSLLTLACWAMLAVCIYAFGVNPYEGWNIQLGLLFGFLGGIMMADSKTSDERKLYEAQWFNHNVAYAALKRFLARPTDIHDMAEFMRLREGGLLLYFNANGWDDEAVALSNIRNFLDRLERYAEWPMLSLTPAAKHSDLMAPSATAITPSPASKRRVLRDRATPTAPQPAA